MVDIDQLSRISSVNSGDLVPVFAQQNRDARAMSMQVLLDFVEANFASPDYVTQIFAPSSSGTTIQFAPQATNLWAIINPTGAFAAMTLVLPSPVGEVFADGAQILVTCSNSVDVLTVNGNGATVFGAPTALGVGGFFTLRYNKLQTRWYCTSQSLGGIGNTFAQINFSTEPATFYDVNGRPALVLARNYPSPGTGSTVSVGLVNDDAGGTPKIQPVSSDPGVDDISLLVTAEGAGEMAIGGGTVRIAAQTSVNIQGPNNVFVGAGTGISLSALAGTVELNAQNIYLAVTGSLGFDAIIADFNGYVSTGGAIRIPAVPFASLATILGILGSTAGVRATCSDSTLTFSAANFGANVTAGGGANVVPVVYDGANWKVG